MNKKGTDKILSIYWFAILVIVAGGIFGMVYNFYGSSYDVRGIESEILSEKIADCISTKGTIDADFLDKDKFDPQNEELFAQKCSFNFNVEDIYEDEAQYFYDVEFFTLDDTNNPQIYFSGGNLNWKNDCFLKKGDEGYSKLAKCDERRFYSLAEDGTQYLIKILSAVGKSEKNVK